jgi:S-adenosylmethionine hydrolase
VNITKIETTFPELEVFADAAVLLAKGGEMEKLGPVYQNLYRPAPLLPTMDNSVINGSVIYIDSYSNVITNITRVIFEKVGKGRRFEILVQSNHNRITRLNNTYGETPNGELLALFNSIELLEVSINKGNAADLLNLGMNSVVRVKFFDTPERDELKLT